MFNADVTWHGEHRGRMEEAEAVFANLNGKKQLARFVGLGHGFFLASNPEKWEQVVFQFLGNRE